MHIMHTLHTKRKFFSNPLHFRKDSPIRSLHWRHNDHDGVSNHQPHGCLHNRLFRRRSKKTSKLRVTGLCVRNSSVPVNTPHKGPVTRKMFPFDEVIMDSRYSPTSLLTWMNEVSPTLSKQIDFKASSLTCLKYRPNRCDFSRDHVYRIGLKKIPILMLMNGGRSGNIQLIRWR